MVKSIAIAAVGLWAFAAGAAAECALWRDVPMARLSVANNTTVPLTVYAAAPDLAYEGKQEIPPLTELTIANFLPAGRNRILLAVTVDGTRHERSGADIVVNNVGPATCERVFTVTVLARDFAGVVFPADPSPSSQPVRGKHLGCFGDNRSADPAGTNGRDLNGRAFSAPDMTVEKCVSACAANVDFKYAGVQYGSWCFCGTKHGGYGTGTCNMPCSGNKQQTCGGVWANDVYEIVR